MQLQKEGESNPKQSSCKKVCGSQEGHRDFKVAAKKWLYHFLAL